MDEQRSYVVALLNQLRPCTSDQDYIGIFQLDFAARIVWCPCSVCKHFLVSFSVHILLLCLWILRFGLNIQAECANLLAMQNLRHMLQDVWKSEFMFPLWLGAGGIRQEITHRASGASNHKGSRPPASSLTESLGQTKGWNSHIEKLQGKVIQNPEDILQ